MKRRTSVPGNKSDAKVVDIKGKGKEKEPVRPHVKASLEDINWVRSQPPCVQQLWLDCVAVEQFGCQQRKLETSLSKNFFPKAKKALEARGLFKFERTYITSDAGRAVATGWKVENLHGYYNKKYWELSSDDSDTSPSKRDETARKEGEHSTERGMTSPSKSDDISRKEGEETPETRAMTEAAKNEPTFNYPSTTPQPPTKVVGEGSREGSIPQETPQTPLGGAGATSGGMQEEEEEEEAPDTHSPSVEDKREIDGTPTDLGEGKSSGGDNIVIQPNNDVIATVEGDSESDDDDDAVGHGDIIEAICARVQEYYYYPTEEQKSIMMQLTISQLQVLSERFQKQMSQRMSLPSPAKTKLAFEFALGLAYGKPLPLPIPQN